MHRAWNEIPPEGKVADSVGDEGLNLRDNPSEESEIITVLPKRARIAILDEVTNGETEWLRLWARDSDGKPVVGWAAGRFVDQDSV